MSVNSEINEGGRLYCHAVANDPVKKGLVGAVLKRKDELNLTVRNFYTDMYSTYCIL
jgi:hypothetical protein